MYRKNTAGQFIGFAAINASTGAAMTGTTGFAAFRVLDGTQATATGSVTDKANGQYSFALSQADTNGNNCSILFTMTGMIPVEKTFLTTGADPTDGVRFGLTALPNAAANANGGLPILSTSGTTLAYTVTTVTTVTNQLTAAQIATGIWQDTTAGDFTTASSIGKSLYTGGVVPGGTNGIFIAGTNAATSITTALTANIIGNITGNLSGSVGSVTAGVTVTTNNDKTGYTLTVTPPTAAAIATAVWQDTTAGDFTVASSIGKSLYTAGVVPGDSGGLFIAGTNAATVVTTSFTTTFTGNLTGSVASVASGVALTSAGLDAVVVEVGLNARQALSIAASALAGIGGDTSGFYEGAGVATHRITYTASAGERTAVTLNPPT